MMDTMTPKSPIKDRIINALWNVDLAQTPVWKRALIQVIRLFYAVIRDLGDGQLTLRAMSLVYTTLLSLVPLLAVSFSVLKGFGVHNQVEPALLNILSFMGDQGVEIAGRIIGFVDNVKVGVLGSLGLALLLYTVISLLQKIETSFNYTWRVKSLRPASQRFSGYLSVVMIGPVLIFTALGLTTTMSSNAVTQELMAIEPFGTTLRVISRLIPYMMIIGAFTFIYIIVPNAKVKIRSALIGGFVSGILWETSGWIFAAFLVSSTKQAAIYSAFASLILFMFWLYLCWLILLIGASIAFYHQHPEHLATPRRNLRLSNRLKEKLTLQVAYLIGTHYYQERPAWTREALSKKLKVPMELVDSITQCLQHKALLTRSKEKPYGFVPTRPLEAIEIDTLLDAVRSDDEGPYLRPDRLAHDMPVENLVKELDKARSDALKGRTVKDLASGTGRHRSSRVD
ncbi:hypothetical protein BOW53_11945 [Solemya pervernicosa gill symbiont]|uniref:Uncharacterized protein n=2 Tax=Gammaproteobacteria incertae sedis TaxID=118884 RepID=A0A1T2L2Q9_9GAMM|nr:hypothetical protein BOW53_11945 [Solemya pervernicosa gill symbiont]